jgi:uncharacterized membrane protein YqjE
MGGLGKSIGSLIVVGLALLAMVIFLPAYRWFLLISFGVGVVVAVALFLWNKYRPVKEAEVDDKHPLGLG